MQTHSLKSKLLATIFALVIGSCVLIALIVTDRYSSSLHRAATARTENIAQSIALEATDKILINDLVALQKTLDHQLHSNAEVTYIFISRNREILAHTFSKGIPIDLIGANTIETGEGVVLKKIISTEGEHYLDIAWPILSGKAGTLRLGMSDASYRKQISQLWIQIGAITGAILLAAIGLGLVFIRHITRPLTSLADTVEKIDEGHLEAGIKIESQDEVGKLATSFQKMILRIKDYTRRLEDNNEALDRAHQQTRTSFMISQQINALSNLKDICSYLINKLQAIVTCKDMIVLVFNQNKDTVFVHSDKEARTLEGKPAKTAYAKLAELRSMAFLQKNPIETDLFQDALRSSEKLVAFPMRHEDQLLGAMMIACPGDCDCIATELDVIDMILNQSCSAIRRAAAHEEEIRELKTRIELSSGFGGLIGKDSQMQVVYKLIEDVAPTDATVLIQGESGTGKELVARAIHNQSLRRDKPFVVINCSAYPTTLLESELFGHEKGAFTGAVRQKAGRFEQADGGTVFLDEIGEISSTAQIKMLRILQSRQFERLGGEKTLSVDVRILAATNKELLKEVKIGNFREDLFYRLNVIPIQMPALRNRRNDIPLLARHFLRHFAAEQGNGAEGISSDAMRLLLDYHWPGNVRELENSIEHAAVLAKGKNIEISDLPKALVQAEPEEITATPKRTIYENERKLLLEVLDECSWNKKAAAHRLGISRSTLYDKLKKYQIAKPTLH
ncbi:MAG: sigma 54-interacting transcriptional regulator [Desulfobacterales bacterium]|nr:MAG: sigma 54-interacting transcriptional regulator [Desulfobacterales bacterium]